MKQLLLLALLGCLALAAATCDPTLPPSQQVCVCVRFASETLLTTCMRVSCLSDCAFCSLAVLWQRRVRERDRFW